MMRKNLVVGLVRFAFACAVSLGLRSFAETDPTYYAVEASAKVQNYPAQPQITLSWPADPNATGYTVARKTATSWSTLTNLPGTATTVTDIKVVPGATYEYGITKTTTLGYTGTGYVFAGINIPAIETRGKILLIVDNTYASQLATELTILEQDLIGDGWTVIRHDVSRSDSVVNIKNLIKADYNADPTNVRTVFLFGHVPVPYSGNLNPDGHPDHQGAWPADVFYGDMNGTWTDSTVNNTSAARQANWNVPGDGKYDQSELPSDVELEVGRVDLSNMTCFSNKTPSRSELDLLRQYLNKDHTFRQGRLNVQRRGIVCDNFGERSGEAFASSGWRNFAPFFGANNVVAAPAWTFFSTLGTQDYLWAYGTGGGSYTTCNGVGGSDDFATTDLHAVFTMFLGSYFGDWDNESAFLRAPLGSTSYTLTSSWAGRPHWFYHHMGLGQTIGYSTRLTQNNSTSGFYKNQVNYGAGGVHVALMGDPTLRMHPVIPASNVQASLVNGVTLAWNASTDSGVQGYYIYRSNSPKGPFTRISGSYPVTTLTYDDASGVSGQSYMVRAVKLEQSGSGTYLNPSEGVVVTAGSTSAVKVPAAPTGFAATATSSTQIQLAWASIDSSATGTKLYRKTGSAGAYAQIATLPQGVVSFSDSGLPSSTQYFYELAAYNTAGDSAFSNEASATTAAPVVAAGTSAKFVTSDSTTHGSWTGAYGADGYSIVGNQTKLPTYLQFSTSWADQWVWANSTSDLSAVQKAGSASTDRIASCWYSASFFDLALTFTDSSTHRVSIYCMDWAYSGRQQTVQVLDAVTGAVLHSQTISGYGGGIYLTYDLAGKVLIRSTHVAGANATVNAIFFDPAGTTSSQPPATTSNAVRYLGQNTTASGNWKGVFGSQGYSVIANSTLAPTYASFSPIGQSDWTWNDPATIAPALVKPNSTDRIAACWYSYAACSVTVNVTDGQTHKVSFYSLDWDHAGRAQTVDVLDGATGAVLHTVSLSNFSNGTYLSYDVKGKVTFRFTRTAGPNAVLSGVFFDAPSASL